MFDRSPWSGLETEIDRQVDGGEAGEEAGADGNSHQPQVMVLG
jgi:hypothetical protein